MPRFTWTGSTPTEMDSLRPIRTLSAVLLILLAAPAYAAPPQRERRASDPNVLAAEDYLQKGEYGKAHEALELAARLRPKGDPEVYIMLAVCRLNLEQRRGAVDACEQGLQAFPGNVRIERYCSTLFSDVLSGDELRDRLNTALERNPNSGVLQKALGRVLLESRSEDPRTEQLLAGARKALPRDAEANFLYGKWACVHQKEAVCVQALSTSLALTKPDNYAAVVLVNGMIGVAQDRLNRPRAAILAFDRAVAAYAKMDTPAPEVPYQYVRFLLARSEHANAQRVNALILRLNPQFAPAHLEQAQLLFRAGRIESSVDEANLALKYSSADKTQLRAIHSFLVKAYATLNRADDARIHQSWVDLNP